MRKKYSDMTSTEIGKILDRNFKKYEFCTAVDKNIKVLRLWNGKYKKDEKRSEK